MDYYLDSLRAALRLLWNLDPEVMHVALNSLGISCVAVLLASLVGVPLGVLTALSRFPGKSLLRGALNVAAALPTVVVGLLLYGLLGRAGFFGEWGLLFTRSAIVLGQFVLITPLIWNLSIAAVSSADARIVYTCRLFGASPLQYGFMVLREVRFAVLAALIAGFGRAISEVGISILVGGNIKGVTRTLTSAIVVETSRGEFELALALGLFLLGVAMLVIGLLHWFQGRGH